MTTGEDLINALYLAASKPNDNLSIGLLKVSHMSLSHCILGRNEVVVRLDLHNQELNLNDANEGSKGSIW